MRAAAVRAASLGAILVLVLAFMAYLLGLSMYRVISIYPGKRNSRSGLRESLYQVFDLCSGGDARLVRDLLAMGLPVHVDERDVLQAHEREDVAEIGLLEVEACGGRARGIAAAPGRDHDGLLAMQETLGRTLREVHRLAGTHHHV